MPTILSHAAVPLALGLGLDPARIPRRLLVAGVLASILLVAGVLASILPDLDVLAFRFHIAYAHVLGHRGASHSLVFAGFVGLVACALAHHLRANRRTAFWFVAVCAASHGVLDMFTNGGLGAALWWPFSDVRVFAPWQVIEVSPLSLQRVFSARGWAVLQSELLWIWLPAALTCAVLMGLRNRSTPQLRG